MNNSIKIFFLAGTALLLSSCCSNVSQDKTNLPNSERVLKNPTSISINKSIVTARVLEILSSENEKENFAVKASIIKVEEDSAYPNMAVEGEVYILVPNYQLDEEKKIMLDSEKNKKLSSLGKQKPGTEFKAVIFFENPRGWFIQQVL